MIEHLTERLKLLRDNRFLMLQLWDDVLTDQELKQQLFTRIGIRNAEIKDTQNRINLLNHTPELVEGQYPNTANA